MWNVLWEASCKLSIASLEALHFVREQTGFLLVLILCIYSVERATVLANPQSNSRRTSIHLDASRARLSSGRLYIPVCSLHLRQDTIASLTITPRVQRATDNRSSMGARTKSIELDRVQRVGGLGVARGRCVV